MRNLFHKGSMISTLGKMQNCVFLFSDKNIEERLVPPDQLMTRLRGRVSQYKSWNDSIKALKMAVLNVSINLVCLNFM